MELCGRCSFRIFISVVVIVLHTPHAHLLDARQSGTGSGTPTSSVAFSISNGGGSSATTLGQAAAISVGYARIQPSSGSTTPSGVAIFGFRQNNILVSEAGVPASPLISSGRIHAEVSGPVNTGMAIANPNSESAVVTFYFSDETRSSFGAGTTTISAGGQIAAFLNETPFNGASPINGTFTFTSNVPVAAVALRGFTNERSEFLLTTLPVSPLIAPTGEIAYFPHFADGGGWTTQVILVNPTDDSLTGTLQFFGQGSLAVAAQPVPVTIGGQTNSSFTYSIPARSSRQLKTAGSVTPIQAGSVRVTPSVNGKTPLGLTVFSFRNGAVTVAEAGVSSAGASQAFRLYAEASGAPGGSIQTGIAIANPAPGSLQVTFELQTLSGGSMGLTGSVTVPGNGQIAQFLNQIPGFGSLTTPFQGILRISTTAVTGISVVGLRGRYNERGDFLITTTPPVDEGQAGGNEELLFPHLADGGGYTTQFVLLSNSTNQTRAGTIQFRSRTGTSLNLALTTSSSNSQVTWSYNGSIWSPSSTPPACPDPLRFTLPSSLSRATAVLYPGQLRGGNYKPHGGFLFNNQGHDLQIAAPMDASIHRGARYLENGNVQYMFDFINACGIMYRLDHLLTLTPRFQQIAATLPQGGEGQSATTQVAPGQTVSAGEIIATAIGVPASNNIFYDWGVYDLRTLNAASRNSSWLSQHPGEMAPYAICWLEHLSPSDTTIVRALPPGDFVSGATSDYCR